jgi:hypothetical protein
MDFVSSTGMTENWSADFDELSRVEYTLHFF